LRILSLCDQLRKWADVMLIAPLSANTLAKVSHGLCDNLLTCIVRAWDFSKPLLVAPAMNTHMWSHPFTAPQLDILQRLGVVVIPPISKRLACGDVGVGAMAAVESIVDAVKEAAQALSPSAQPVPSSSSSPQ
jgi:phosphopantothenoylcysteine decarboxylase